MSSSEKHTQIGRMTAKQKVINVVGAIVICVGAVLVMNVLDKNRQTSESQPKSNIPAESSSSLIAAPQKTQAQPAEKDRVKVAGQNNAQAITPDNQQALADKQAEIEALVKELDGNLGNPEEKLRLEGLINQKLHEYNQLILPEALKQMSAAQ
ncbi:hypothetical protein [Catenovulum agarivorans]|uniref:hypothetical protein n=1 Tax=Catenovulum agarivorans TaxID=1172192 RepID=UPI0002FD69A1|nr:hypothetical protein [Catenovulum agarivorans]